MPKIDDLDVLSYELVLNIDIDNESFLGTVNIDFQVRQDTKKVVFDCGNLLITEITGKNVASFERENQKLIIYLNNRGVKENHIQITYSGNSSQGIVFIPKNQEVYTVFSTSQWMVCNGSPIPGTYTHRAPKQVLDYRDHSLSHKLLCQYYNAHHACLGSTY